MLTLQLRNLALFMLICLLIGLQMFPAAATKVKTKSKSSAISSSSTSLAISKMTNSKSHLLDISSATLSLSAKKLANGIGLHGIGSGLKDNLNTRYERQKQRHSNDKDQMLAKKHILRTVYQPQSTENLAGISLDENDLVTKHRRKLEDKLSKKLLLLRNVNTEQREDAEDEREMAAMEARNVNVTRHIRSGSSLGNSRITQHIILKPTIQTMTLISTHSPQTSSLPPTPTTISSYSTNTTRTTMNPAFHNIRKMHTNKLSENQRLLSSNQPFDNGQLTKSYHHYQSSAAAGAVADRDGDGDRGNEEHRPRLPLLPLLGALHPEIAKESIDLDMNTVDEDEEEDNEHKDLSGSVLDNSNTKENDVIRTIIGEVGGDYGGGERGGADDNNNDNDDDNDKDNDDADADDDVEDEGIMDDLNGFDASDDSDNDDDDDADEEDDDNNVDADDEQTGNDGGDEADDVDNANTNVVPAENSDNAANEDASTANISNNGDEATGNVNAAVPNDNENDNDNTEAADDADVGDDVFDNDYSDTDDVFSDLSAYHNDEDEADYDTTTSSSLLPSNKYHNDDNDLDNSKRPYNNFTETYIKDTKNELSLDNYLRKSLPLLPVAPIAPSPPSAEVLKSELNIPITKIDNSLLVDFHVKSNHSISLQSQDFSFLSNNFIQENDSMLLEAYATSRPKGITSNDILSASALNMEPQISASTSVGGINLDHQHHQNTMYEKEEINFNDSEDATSLSKDLIMDDAFMENNHANGFPLTDADTDSDSESLSLDVPADSESNENNRFLEGAVDAANADEIYDWDEISRSNRRNLMRGRDVVTKFLQIVETQHSLGSNCEAGTSLNLGEGVVDRYAQDRFRIEAEVAVNRANMLTSLTLDLPTSCAEPNGFTCSKNKCRIKTENHPSTLLVPCDEDWIVFQRRINGSVNFNRDWSDYKNGFGDLDGEFWLGLDNLHALTEALAPVELMIKMKDFEGTEKYARYNLFYIGSENQNYQMVTIGAYSGDAGDSLTLHRDEEFTTYDNDNDKNLLFNCASAFSGGWWFYDCDNGRDNCNLNGEYYDGTSGYHRNGIKWTTFRANDYSLKFVQMMIRQKEIQS